MKKKKISSLGAMMLCWEMWDWLAKNPRNEKSEWPGWKNKNKWHGEHNYWGWIGSFCFACRECEYDCFDCIMLETWCGKSRKGMFGPWIACSDRGSPYNGWGCARTSQQKTKYARKIANGALKQVKRLWKEKYG